MTETVLKSGKKTQNATNFLSQWRCPEVTPNVNDEEDALEKGAKSSKGLECLRCGKKLSNERERKMGDNQIVKGIVWI